MSAAAESNRQAIWQQEADYHHLASMHVDDTNDAFVSQMAAYSDQNFRPVIKK